MGGEEEAVGGGERNEEAGEQGVKSNQIIGGI